jgi:diguanylate cyclase (GGDEF)-like protein
LRRSRFLAAALCAAATLPGVAAAACLASGAGDLARLEQLAFLAPSGVEAEVQAALAASPDVSAQRRAHLYAIAGAADQQLGRAPSAFASASTGLAMLAPDTSSDLAIRLRILQGLVDANEDAALRRLVELEPLLHTRPLALACLLRDRSVVHANRGNVKEALADQIRAHQLLGEYGTPQEQMVSTSRLSLLYHTTGDRENALRLIDESIAYFRANNAQVRVATALDRRATILAALKRYEEARFAADQALNLSVRANDAVGAAYLQFRICRIATLQGDYRAAIENCEVAKRALVAAKAFDEYENALYGILMGSVRVAMGEWSAGANHLTGALTLAKWLPPDDIARAHEERAKARAALGDAAGAYADMAQFVQRLRQRTETERVQAQAGMQVRFDTDRAQQQNALLAKDKALAQAQLKRQGEVMALSIAVAVASLVAVAMLGYVVWANRRYRRQLTQLAERDELTGLDNRRKLVCTAAEQISRIRANGGQLAIGLVDLDHFKAINDRFGHASGDAVLKHFSNVAKQQLRGNDVVGRYGGEEFLILLPDTTPSAAFATLDRLRRAIAQQSIVAIDGRSIEVTVSIGIAHVGATDVLFDQVARRADLALYAAKANGRDRVETYDAELHSAASFAIGTGRFRSLKSA